MHLMRCNNSSTSTQSSIETSTPTAFATLSLELWHSCLGHRGATTLSYKKMKFH